nr:terminase family protein [uncultured Cohaesibacter sp.]
MSGPISKEEWAKARQLSEDAVLERISKRKALLSYQSHTVELLESTGCEVLFVEKSRQIGLTWACASYAVLKAARTKEAGGMDFMYISYSQEMTREFIDACAMWCRAFSEAAMEMEEFLFDDSDANGERAIQAFRIKFSSGFEIVGLSSAPRTLRGKQGVVMIDEAAFVDSLEELLKAALAFLMWGGQVIVCSTHDGFDNHFNEQIQDILAGKQDYQHLKITFDDALREGLYERICLVTGKEWSPELEADWRAKIIKAYGAGADEELFCIPSSSSGTYLSRALIVARMKEDIPVIRYTPPEGFVDWPEALRKDEIEDFCKEQLLPHLEKLNPKWRSGFGQDFGRSGDLSVIHPFQVRPDLSLACPFILELRNVPFEAQKQIAFYLWDHLPRASHAAFDATGNGAYLAEVCRQKFGTSFVSEIKLSQSWYILNMPKLKAAFEDGLIELPKDDDILADYRLLKMHKGVAKVPDDARIMGSDGFERHGDSAPAGALAVFASEQDTGEVGAGSSGERPSAKANQDIGSSLGSIETRADLSAFTRM